MSRRSRSEIVELIQSTMPWEEVSVRSLPPKAAATYRHRKDALEMYMAGSSIADITHETKVDSSYLKKMIKRCLSVASDGIVYGARALLPNIPMKSYTRTKDVDSSLWQSGAGLAGVLGAIFERYPDIELQLNAIIMKKKALKGKEKTLTSKGKTVHEFAIKSKDVHESFIRLLKDKEHPNTEWPFNAKYRGLRTISKHVKEVREQNYERSVHITGDSAAIAHIPVGTGYPSLTKSAGLMEIIEIDSYTYNSAFVLAIEHAYGLTTYHVLKNLHVLAAVESLASAVLWYYVVHGDDVTAEDVLALIRQMLSEEHPKPPAVIEGLKLKSGAGYPADVIPEMNQVQPSVIRLDNALAHLANKVCHDVRKQIGCIVEYGVPRRPERRPNVERVFKSLSVDLCQRFPSTTGTGPDKGRATDPGKAALHFKVNSDALDELTYSYFAEYNSEPSEGLRSLSPLEAIKQLAEDEHFIPRRPPFDKRKSLGVAYVRVPRVVRGGVKSRHHLYINFKRARYTSPRLVDSPALVGKTIFIEVNEFDIRVVDAFTEIGEPIGPLTAQGSWALEPHSLKTRNDVNSLIAQKIISRTEGDSLFDTYRRHLTATLVAAEKKNRQDRATASKLDRLNHEQSQLLSAAEFSEESTTQQAAALDIAPQAEPAPSRDFLVPTSSLDLLDLVKKL